MSLFFCLSVSVCLSVYMCVSVSVCLCVCVCLQVFPYRGDGGDTPPNFSTDRGDLGGDKVFPMLNCACGEILEILNLKILKFSLVAPCFSLC